MLNLRATVRLAKFFKVELEPEPAAGQAVLGDWYANLVVEDDFRMVMCVNALTRYAMPIQLRGRANADELYNQLQMRIHRAVSVLPIDHAEAVADEVAQQYAGGMVIAKTADRSILATLNDLIQVCPRYLDDAIHPFGGIDWHYVEARLNDVPRMSVGAATGTEMMAKLLRQPAANGKDL